MSNQSNSLNKKLNLYFKKNPEIDKNKIIWVLEMLIKGEDINNEDMVLLNNTQFFDIVYEIPSKNYKIDDIDDVELFKIKSKITTIYDLLKSTLQSEDVTLYDLNIIFDDSNNEDNKKIVLNFNEYYNYITNKIFNICHNKITGKKGKFNYSSEIIIFLNEIMFLTIG